MVSLSITTLLVLVTVTFAWGQLVVNVKNKGGEVLQETILANISLDTIRLDFQEYDGTLIAQFIDFKNVSAKAKSCRHLSRIQAHLNFALINIQSFVSNHAQCILNYGTLTYRLLKMLCIKTQF